MTPDQPGYTDLTAHLKAILHHPDPNWAWAQVQSFRAQSAHSNFLPWFNNVLQDPSALYRRRACQMLGWLEVAASEVSQLLTSALHDPSWPVREAAALALGSQGPAICPALVESLLEEKEPLVRLASARTLAQVEGTGASHALASAAQDRSINRRRRALEALSHFSNQPGAVQTLLRALDDSHLKIRATAAQALGQLGALALPALPRLVRCCHDQAPRVRLAAVQSARAVGQQAPGLQPWLPILMESISPQLLMANLLGHPELPEDVRMKLVSWKFDRGSVRRQRQEALRALGEVVQLLMK